MRKPLESGIKQKPETPQGWEADAAAAAWGPVDVWLLSSRGGCGEKEAEIFLFGCHQPQQNLAEKGGAAAPP